MYNSTLVNIKDSIATRLLAIVFSIYFIVTLTVTLTHMIAEYQNEKHEIIGDLETFYETFSPGLATAQWDMYHEQRNAVLKGMIKIPVIVGIKMETLKGKLIEARGIVHNSKGEIVTFDATGKRKEEFSNNYNLLEVKKPLIYLEGDIENHIAQVTLYSSSEIVFNKVQYGFIFIIVNSIIKTLALWIIFLMVSRKLLSQPLSILTEATENLNFDHLENVKLHIKTSGRNELKKLEESFHKMIEKLILSKKRSISLRFFANKIGEFEDDIKILRFAFNELCDHTLISNGILFFDSKNQQFTQHQTCKLSHDFLTVCPSTESMKELFLQKDQSICIFNSLKAENRIFKYYPSYFVEKLLGWHLVLINVSILENHLICLFRQPDEPPFDSVDIEYIQSIIEQIKIAHRNIETIRHSVRMEGELQTAAALQQAFFPENLPQYKNIELASYFQSATETGGDWYGFITKFEGSLYILIGDVTGHGVSAALVTATASATCKAIESMYFQEGRSPAPSEILHELHHTVGYSGSPNFLMTFFVAQLDLDTGIMSFSNAGHNFPILIRKNGKVHHLLNRNILLGYDSHWDFKENSIQLENEDLLVFYTDGIIENMNSKNEMLTKSKLIHYLKKYQDYSSQELVLKVIQDVQNFYEGHPIDDDMTLVALKIIKPFEESLPVD